MIKRSSQSWVTRHRTSLSTIACILIACITFLLLVTLAANRTIEINKRKTLDLSARYDKLIPELTAKREAREAAEKAAAAKVAEEAKTAAPVTSPQTASKCNNLLRTHGDPNQIDILVNKAHCLSPLDFAPSDLVSVDGYLISAKAAPALHAMLKAAANDGLTITPTSSYRSYGSQVATYNEKVAIKGSTESADTVTARPGYSEHQTGLAVDFSANGCVLECFAGTPHYTWLQQHAASYGFIQRYHAGLEEITGYSPEAWHYRYVGPKTALDMKAKGIKTLEQYWNISGGNYPS